MEKEIVKEYSNNEMTIVWKPKLCIHAGECVKQLPNVYKPKEKPWICIDEASTEKLKKQIKTCPSGALSYYMNDQKSNTDSANRVSLEVLENGPLILNGTVQIREVNGNIELRENKTALCRCGASANKPYCDGAHHKINFKDSK